MSYKVDIYGPLTSEALALYMQLGIDAIFTDVEADGEAPRALDYDMVQVKEYLKKL